MDDRTAPEPSTASEQMFDVRVVKHLMRRQALDYEAYEAYLASLPDEAEHGEPTEAVFMSWDARRQAQRKQD